jgi:hypothetical protein
MPVDSATATVVVAAPFAEVLAVVRDVANQVEWVKEITAAELLEEYEDGTPATARFEMTTGLGADHYTLEFEHGDDAMRWTLVQGTMQKAQNGSYVLRDLGEDGTEVTLSLEVDHSIPAPGFLRKKIFTGVVEGNLAGLKRYVEA